MSCVRYACCAYYGLKRLSTVRSHMYYQHLSIAMETIIDICENLKFLYSFMIVLYVLGKLYDSFGTSIYSIFLYFILLFSWNFQLHHIVIHHVFCIQFSLAKSSWLFMVPQSIEVFFNFVFIFFFRSRVERGWVNFFLYFETRKWSHYDSSNGQRATREKKELEKFLHFEWINFCYSSWINHTYAWDMKIWRDLERDIYIDTYRLAIDYNELYDPVHREKGMKEEMKEEKKLEPSATEQHQVL